MLGHISDKKDQAKRLRARGAPVRPHLFRRARVRQILRHTMSLTLAQKQAGWARVHTQYRTLSDEEARSLTRIVPY